MKRREFVETSLAGIAASASFSSGSSGLHAQEKAKEFYELRLYHLRIHRRDAFSNYLRDALVPALNRQGIKTVGVFNVMVGPDSPTVYVLIPYSSLDLFATLSQRLASDSTFQKAGAAGLSAPPNDPLYARVESSLLSAFDSFPNMEVPKKDPRIFELRSYESPTEVTHLKKMEMFTPQLGELDIFRRNSLVPVFFGKTLIGSRMPNFTYMLTYPDLAARAKNWAGFAADPAWKKLSTTAGYTDVEIMSNITNVFLTPAAFSQV